jgi:SacI restriction endonuclease
VSRPIEYNQAKRALSELFTEAEMAFPRGETPPVPASFSKAVDTLFTSRTQSFREVALGCALVRLLDKRANLRLPYANQGSLAYNGRTLDEKVVNPFLHDRQIPASKGPYLATFRRSVRFERATRKGMRDKDGYDAFLQVIATLEKTTGESEIRDLIRHLLYRFVMLRDEAQIPLALVNRLNLAQYDQLLAGLLETPSGGLIPVLLTVAMLQALKQCFVLAWTIEWQGINVADRASGAGGDVTVRKDGELHFAIEITERPIDRSRVVSTFNTKIGPGGISDYLFIFAHAQPSPEARQYAEVLFSQGHDVNFVEIKPWLINNLATLGGVCRTVFTKEFLGLLGNDSVPATLKVKWNDLVKQLLN